MFVTIVVENTHSVMKGGVITGQLTSTTHEFNGPVTKITVDGEEWVPKVYHPTCTGCNSPEPQFKVGDFVRVLDTNWSTLEVGVCGKIVCKDDGFLGVEFSEPFKSGWTLGNNQTQMGHGWYFPPSHLELI